MSEKHLRITSEEVVALPELTYAELKLYLYLRTLDPFGDRKLDIETAFLSKQLGFSRRTIQRSLHKLNESDLIDWQVTKSKITTKTATSLSLSDKAVAKRQDCRLGDKAVAETTNLSPKRQECRERPLEASQDNGSTTSHPSSSFFNLSQSDQDDFFIKNENLDTALCAATENLTDFEKAIYSCTDEAIEKCNLKPVEDVESANTPEHAINPIEGDLSRRSLEDFILRSLKVSPRDRAAYFSRFTQSDWEKWEFRFKPSVSPPVNKSDPVAEDPYRLEVAIASMIKCKDFEAAKERLNKVEESDPVLAKKLRGKYLCN